MVTSVVPNQSGIAAMQGRPTGLPQARMPPATPIRSESARGGISSMQSTHDVNRSRQGSLASSAPTNYAAHPQFVQHQQTARVGVNPLGAHLPMQAQPHAQAPQQTHPQAQPQQQIEVTRPHPHPVTTPSDEPGPSILGTMLSMVWGGDTVKNLRIGVKGLLCFVTFLAWVATEEDYDCPVNLSDWLLAHSLVLLAATVLCVVLCAAFQSAVGKALEADLSASEESQRNFQRASWGVTMLAGLWSASFVIVMLAKLKKGSKATCGSAFSGTAAIVGLTGLAVLVCALVFISRSTAMGDHDDYNLDDLKTVRAQQRENNQAPQPAHPQPAHIQDRSKSASTSYTMGAQAEALPPVMAYTPELPNVGEGGRLAGMNTEAGRQVYYTRNALEFQHPVEP